MSLEPPRLQNKESQVSLWTSEEAQATEESKAAIGSRQKFETKPHSLEQVEETKCDSVPSNTSSLTSCDDDDDETIKDKVQTTSENSGGEEANVAKVETEASSGGVFQKTDFFEKKTCALKPEVDESAQAFLERVIPVSTRADMSYYTSLP